MPRRVLLVSTARKECTMADARANILLTINSNLEGIRKAQDQVISLTRTTRNAKTELQSFGQTLTQGLGIGAGFSAGASAANILIGSVQKISSAMTQAMTEGVRFNATLEQSTIGVASV